MNFCCSIFKAKWQAQNERGSSIYVCPPESGHPHPSFVLLSRGIDKCPEEELQRMLQGAKLKINVSSRHHIHFCPWCGCELKKFYRESFTGLINSQILVEMGEGEANQATETTRGK